MSCRPASKTGTASCRACSPAEKRLNGEHHIQHTPHRPAGYLGCPAHCTQLAMRNNASESCI